MKKRKLILTLLIFSGQIFAQTINLSLREAVEQANHYNPKIMQAAEKIRQAEYRNYSALGNFLPSANFALSYNHLNDPLQIDLSPIREVIMKLQSANQAEYVNISSILTTSVPLTEEQKNAVKSAAYNALDKAIPPFSETLKKQNYYSGNFNIVQPVFLGGKLLAAKKAAKLEKSAAEIEFKKISDEVTADVISSYLRVVLISNIVETRKKLLSGIENHKANANKLYKEGIIAYNQFLKAEVAKAEAEQKLLEDQNNLRLAMMALSNSIGLEDTLKIITTDTLSLHSFDISKDYMKSYIKNNQPILQLIKEKQDLAAQNYNAKRSVFLPTVAAFGKYEIFPQSLSALEPRWVVGIQLNYNLFNGFKDYLNLQEAKSIENELGFKQKEIENKIFLWFNKSFNEIDNSRSKYEKLSTNRELANESYRINQKRFATGIGSSIEVIDAELSLEKAELESLLAVHDYYQAINQICLVVSDFNLFFETFYSMEKK